MMVTIHRNLNVNAALSKVERRQDVLKWGRRRSTEYVGGCLWVVTPCSDKGSPNAPVSHYTQYACIRNAQSKVSEAGHIRTIEQQRRAVYARIWGECVHPDDVYGWNFHGNPDLFSEVTFTPGCKGGQPTFYYKKTGSHCAQWGAVFFTPQGMFTRTPISEATL